MLWFVITTIIILFFWPSIRNWFATDLIAFIREKISDECADYCVDVIAWLDKKICGIRRGFKTAWKFIKERILRMESDFSLDGNGNCSSTGTVIIDMGNGKAAKITKTEKVEFDSLPPEIQDELIRQNFAEDGCRHGKMNDKEILQKMGLERLSEDMSKVQSEEEAQEGRELETLLQWC